MHALGAAGFIPFKGESVYKVVCKILTASYNCSYKCKRDGNGFNYQRDETDDIDYLTLGLDYFLAASCRHFL